MGPLGTVNPTTSDQGRGEEACAAYENDAITPLDSLTTSLIEQTTGQSMGSVGVQHDHQSTASQGMQGMAQHGQILLPPGAPEADTHAGRQIRLHEAAHVLQQENSGGVKAPTEVVEEEARSIAAAAGSGASRPVKTSAAGSQAHGFSLGGMVESTVEWLAPNIHALITDGPGEMLNDGLSDAANSWLESNMGGFDPSKLLNSLVDNFRTPFDLIKAAATGEGRCCAGLETKVNGLMELLDTVQNSDFVASLQPDLEAQSEAFSKLSDLILAPGS